MNQFRVGELCQNEKAATSKRKRKRQNSEEDTSPNVPGTGQYHRIIKV